MLWRQKNLILTCFSRSSISFRPSHHIQQQGRRDPLRLVYTGDRRKRLEMVYLSIYLFISVLQWWSVQYSIPHSYDCDAARICLQSKINTTKESWRSLLQTACAHILFTNYITVKSRERMNEILGTTTKLLMYEQESREKLGTNFANNLTGL